MHKKAVRCQVIDIIGLPARDFSIYLIYMDKNKPALGRLPGGAF